MSALRIALLADPLTVLVKGARHAQELEAELVRRGHVVRLFGLPQGLPHGLMGGGEPADQGERSQAARFGRTSVLGFEPEALVAYDASSPVALLGARIARRNGLPLVIVEDGRLADGDLLRRTLWRVGECLWGRVVRRAAGCLVALDPVAREHALEQGFDPATIRVLPHGVDIDRWRPGLTSPLIAEHRIRGRILLYAGTLEAGAGLELLINAFARTVGQRGDWSLVIAGRRGPHPRLRACAHRNGVGARVHFLKVSEADLPALFSSATFVAQPALEDRGSGLSLIRAMASGTPTLASDLPRHRHLVEPEESGLLAPPDDLAAWTQTLQRMASSPEARKRWGRRGREIARERFAWPSLGMAWEAALEAARGQVEVVGDVEASQARS
jgi:glycosyltransferase involved in cell wall biosynthesis